MICNRPDRSLHLCDFKHKCEDCKYSEWESIDKVINQMECQVGELDYLMGTFMMDEDILHYLREYRKVSNEVIRSSNTGN